MTGRQRGGVIIAITAVAALLVWFAVPHAPSVAPRKAPLVFTVDVGAAELTDVQMYLEGLGTVQALQTVTVTARVDGQLENVAFIEGGGVHKGDVLAQIDPRPSRAALSQAIGVKARDTAQLENARRDLERYVLLEPEALASKQIIDTQRALVEQLTAQLKIDQAQIDSARTQLDYTRITSPIDGRTGIRLIDPGNIVRAADPTGIVVVTQIEPIAVLFTLPQEHVTSVSAALAAGPVEVQILPREGDATPGGAPLDAGRLSVIDNQISSATGTLKLKAVFDNQRRVLWPGQFVTARLLLRTDRGVLTIPTAAVQLGPTGPFTYVVRADSTVEVRPLQIGAASRGRTIVTAGLKQHERVVVSNQYRLEAGAQVRMSTPPVPAHPT